MGLGSGLTPTAFDHQHRTASANDREKRIVLGFLVSDIEAELIAIKSDSGCSVAHNEKRCDAFITGWVIRGTPKAHSAHNPVGAECPDRFYGQG